MLGKRKASVFGLIRRKEKMNGNSNGFGSAAEMATAEYIRRHHRHETGENQCSSALFKHIKAHVPLVSLSLTLCLRFVLDLIFQLNFLKIPLTHHLLFRIFFFKK